MKRLTPIACVILAALVVAVTGCPKTGTPVLKPADDPADLPTKPGEGVITITGVAGKEIRLAVETHDGTPVQLEGAAVSQLPSIAAVNDVFMLRIATGNLTIVTFQGTPLRLRGNIKNFYMNDFNNKKLPDGTWEKMVSAQSLLIKHCPMLEGLAIEYGWKLVNAQGAYSFPVPTHLKRLWAGSPITTIDLAPLTKLEELSLNWSRLCDEDGNLTVAIPHTIQKLNVGFIFFPNTAQIRLKRFDVKPFTELRYFSCAGNMFDKESVLSVINNIHGRTFPGVTKELDIHFQIKTEKPRVMYDVLTEDEVRPATDKGWKVYNEGEL